ncbi:hypothetical protein [Methyloprofundus sp.]|uniref:hypothetical protein n=1 Tax=Methyloprofundus sp. TaxID=2020875 RepID=UPI003D11E3F3
MAKSLNKLFLVLSIIVLTSFMSVSSAQSTPKQKNAAKAIGYACEGLIIGVTRSTDVELDDNLIAIYTAHVEAVFAMRRHPRNEDIAEARGIITREALINISRNPLLMVKIKKIVAMCVEDLDAL